MIEEPTVPVTQVDAAAKDGRLEEADIETMLARLDPPEPAPAPGHLPDPSASRPTSGAKRGAEAQDTASRAPISRLLHTMVAELEALRRAHEELLVAVRSTLAVRRDAGGADARAAAELPSVKRTVLLVDDDVVARNAAARVLEQQGLRVCTVSSAASALATISVEQPDAIVVELGLDGELSGQQLLDVIRATMEWVRIPVVLYTGQPMRDIHEVRAVHAADEYVPKSEGPNELADKVAGLLSQSRAPLTAKRWPAA